MHVLFQGREAIEKYDLGKESSLDLPQSWIYKGAYEYEVCISPGIKRRVPPVMFSSHL